VPGSLWLNEHKQDYNCSFLIIFSPNLQTIIKAQILSIRGKAKACTRLQLLGSALAAAGQPKHRKTPPITTNHCKPIPKGPIIPYGTTAHHQTRLSYRPELAETHAMLCKS